MKNKTLQIGILLLMLLPATQNSHSQDAENKWVIGAGMNATDFFPTNQKPELTGNTGSFWNEFFNVNDHWNQFGFPKIHLTRHIKNKFAVDGAFTMNKLAKIGEVKVNNLSYIALDTSLQYSILEDNYTFYPYLFLGAGYTWVDNKGTGTFNSGIGITYWFSEKFGVNGHGMFKYSPENYTNVLQHFHYSISIVHRFGNSRGSSDCFVTK